MILIMKKITFFELDTLWEFFLCRSTLNSGILIVFNPLLELSEFNGKWGKVA